MLGDRIERGRIPFIGRRMARRRGDGARLARDRRTRRCAGRWSRGRWPTALLVALAMPAFSMHTKLTGTSDLPRSLAGHARLRPHAGRVPRRPDPGRRGRHARATSRAPQMRAGDRGAARARAGHRAASTTRSTSTVVGGPPRRLDRRPADGRRRHRTPPPSAALAQLRGCDPAADASARAPGAHAYVTGMTAGTKDFNDLMTARAPLVFAFVLTLAFLLLLVTFRSIVIPIKAIALNLLSVGAAYGVLVWVFQDGHCEGLLGFHSNGGDRQLAADVPVRDPVRPDRWTTTCSSSAGSARRSTAAWRTEDAVAPRDQVDGRHRDQRRVRDGRRVRDLRDAAARSTSSRWASAWRSRS